jgi:hypothetical protein
MLNHYSVQVLIASDAMNIENGSTECVPCSHRIPDIDAMLHHEGVREGETWSRFDVDAMLQLLMGLGRVRDLGVDAMLQCHAGVREGETLRVDLMLTRCCITRGLGRVR